MAKIQDIDIPYLEFAEAAAPGTPAAGIVRAYSKTDGLMYSKDDAGVETLMSGGAFTGLPVAILPAGVGKFDGTNTSASAGNGWSVPIVLPAPTRVRAMYLDASASGASAVEWGLFDYSSSATAATKLVGGSAAIGSTGWQAIAATSAPVVVGAGAYMLTWRFPAATGPTVRFYLATSALPWVKTWSTYTWDDTPDFTSASWVESTAVFHVYLEGDMTSGGSRW